MNYSELMKDARIIHTGLYSKVAFDVISAVFGQLADGKWECSPIMEKYWMFGDCKQALDGEVCIRVSKQTGDYDFHTHKYRSNGFYGMSSHEICAFFAKKIMVLVNDEIRDAADDDSGRYSKDLIKKTYCHAILHYLDCKMNEALYIYNYLLGTGKTTTDEDLLLISHSVIGDPRSSDVQARHSSYIKAMQIIDGEYNQKMNAAKADYSQKLKVLDDAHRANTDVISKTRHEKIQILKKEYADILN